MEEDCRNTQRRAAAAATNREKDFGDTTATIVCTLYTNRTDPPDPPDPTDACPETANIATACPTGFWGKG